MAYNLDMFPGFLFIQKKQAASEVRPRGGKTGMWQRRILKAVADVFQWNDTMNEVFSSDFVANKRQA